MELAISRSHTQKEYSMSKQVPWNKIILEEFIKDALLTKEEEMIMRTRVAGWTRQKQSMELNMSLSSIDRIIKRLKIKYDQVEKYNPILPPRRFSVKEVYMDAIK